MDTFPIVAGRLSLRRNTYERLVCRVLRPLRSQLRCDLHTVRFKMVDWLVSFSEVSRTNQKQC